ncbi:MAG: electron transfer flavoprotein subunit alpha/FixB family protein [Synergistaceae bacterium]|jgi:electron transfer flavoprotein alpha subunit|nr:electron transfer flavoprotein subunit alpha/FixB family protein [Synergistaceae bacterium]
MRTERNGLGGVFVVAEVRRSGIHSCTLELVSKARELADARGREVTAIVLRSPSEEPVEPLFRHGADRILLVEDERLGSLNAEVHSRIVAHLIGKGDAEIVLAPATTTGRTLLPAVAALIHTGLTADCTGLEIDAETGLLLQTRPAIGGNVIATIKTPDHLPQMATVRPKTFPVAPPQDRLGRVERPLLDESLFCTSVVCLGEESVEGEEVDIQGLDVIVSGGKGLKRPEGFRLLQELADLLEGAVGASRPTVEAKWISYPHQVGLSGKVVAPRIYLAAGISGAVQHLAGMQTAETIIAVNKDPEAPLFRVADVALCGDLYEILPRLIDAIRREKEERHD